MAQRLRLYYGGLVVGNGFQIVSFDQFVRSSDWLRFQGHPTTISHSGILTQQVGVVMVPNPTEELIHLIHQSR